jgi:hypothetical protein
MTFKRVPTSADWRVAPGGRACGSATGSAPALAIRTNTDIEARYAPLRTGFAGERFDTQ